MEQIEELSRFIKEHASDDLNRLLLSASRYPGIDIPFVVDQLKSRRQIKDNYLHGIKTIDWFFRRR